MDSWALTVLKWPEFDVPIQIPKRPQKIPELLTRQEVKQIIEACHNPKHRMLLLTCYGCGLRVSELVSLKVRHVDGERQLLRVEQGKGAKDRTVMVSAALLAQLRHYWQRYHPQDWLFPNSNTPRLPLTMSTAQKVFKKAKEATGIQKTEDRRDPQLAPCLCHPSVAERSAGLYPATATGA